MCIFFFVVGDAHHPTILCNNRDEYFARQTARGNFYRDEQRNEVDLTRFPLNEHHTPYVPYDLEAGVVLNLDNYSVPTELPLAQLRSRGGLVRQFLQLDPDGHTTAQVYTQDIYAQRHQFRPFNLIVSDGYGHAYYVTSSVFQRNGPERLEPGRLYGISNGYLHDHSWEKVQLGRALLSGLVTPLHFQNIFFDDFLPLIRSHATTAADAAFDTVRRQAFPPLTSSTSCDIPHVTSPEEKHRTNTPHDHSADGDALTLGHGRRALHLPSLFPAQPQLQHFLDKLFHVMTNTQPCADPDYGHNHLPLVHLASIFARPISIDTSIPLTSVTTPAAALPGGSDSYYLPGSSAVTAANPAATLAGTAVTDAPPPPNPATPPSSTATLASPPIADSDAATSSSSSASSASSAAIEVPGVVRQRYQLLPNDVSAAASIVHAAPAPAPASASAPATATAATDTASTASTAPTESTASTASMTTQAAAASSNGASDATPHRIFGTRTITLLVHLSAVYVRTQQQSAPPAAPSASPLAVDRGHFVLIEDDLRMLPPSTTDDTAAAWTQQHVFHSFDNLSAAL
eukprot:gene6724-4848_t